MKKIGLIIFAGLSLLNLQAQTLNEYVQFALENNPEVKATSFEYQTAIERIDQLGGLPDPELTAGFFLQPMERVMGIQQADIRLMQMLPWFGVVRSRKEEAGKMALAQYELHREAKNQLIFNVRSLWYDLYQIDQEIKIARANLNILKVFERIALIRFQGGAQESSQVSTNSESMKNTAQRSVSGSMNGTSMDDQNNSPAKQSSMTTSMKASSESGMSDVLRVRMEMNESESSIDRLQDIRLSRRIEFNKVLNRDYQEEVVIADTLTPETVAWDRLTMLDTILQNNPMPNMLQSEEEAYEAQAKMAILDGRPMLGVGLNYMPFRPRTENGMSMGGKDMIMPMVSFTIPIYRKKYTSTVKVAELQRQVAHQRKDEAINMLKVRWSEAYRDLDDANRRINLYQEQLVLVRQNMNLITTAYSSNGQDFEEILRSQQQLLNYQIGLISAIVDQHKSMAMLRMLAAFEVKN